MEYVTTELLAAGNGAALVGYEQAASGAVAITVQDELRFTLRPEQFGAVGDGVADDAPAINAAITAANSAGGGVVKLSSTNYAVGSPILLKSKVSLVGSGMRKTIITQIGTVEAWGAITSSSGIVTTPSASEYEDIHIARLRVQGLHATRIVDGSLIYATNGISLANTWNSSVVDCYVRDTGTGIIMYGTVTGITDYNNLIARCTVRNARSWNAAGNPGTPRGITMATNRSTVRDTVSDDCYTGYYVATD